MTSKWQQFWSNLKEHVGWTAKDELYYTVIRPFLAAHGAIMTGIGVTALTAAFTWSRAHPTILLPHLSFGAGAAFTWMLLARVLRWVFGRYGSDVPLIISGDEDANIVDQRLYYIELGQHDEQLTGPQPYIDFYISIINASVFKLTWEHEIEGLLHLDGHPLQQPLVIALRDSPQSLQTARGRSGSIAIRQWLTRDSVAYMLGREEIQFAFGTVCPPFSFNHRGQKCTFRKTIAMRNNNVIWTNKEWDNLDSSVRTLVANVPTLLKTKQSTS